MWWCTSLILALSRQRMAQLYDVFFLQKQLTILFSYFTMKPVLFYPTFLLQNYSVRKGEASLATQLEDTQAQHCDLWWNRTRNTKLMKRPSALIHLAKSDQAKWVPSYGEQEVLSWEAQKSWACGLPWVASFQKQAPQASSQEEKDPSLHHESTYCFQATRKWLTHSGWQGRAKDKNQCNDEPDI